MSDFDFDLFTLGAGSGGVSASRLAGTYGARVGICEEDRAGGTCVLRGCVPKKLLVYASHAAEELEDAAGFGWRVPKAELDWGALIAAKDRELDRLNSVYNRMLRDAGVTMVEGRGTLVDAHTVRVGDRTYSAQYILVATGSWPRMPNIPGIEHVITSNEALARKELPQSMTIVGGGYIGVEFASIFNAVGVAVTQIVRADTLLRGFDQDIRVTLAEEMGNKGVQLRTETVVRSIERVDNGYSVRLDHGDILHTDLVMYATGRTPNTSGLGLEEVGVELNAKGAVVVNADSQSTVPSIYAVGDATDRVNLTPVAIREGRALVNHLFRGERGTVDYETIPSAVFAQPPVGTVGLTEAEARHRHDAIDVYRSRFRPIKHTLSGRNERTMMKLIVKRESDQVLGCHMVGPDAPEIIQGIGIALKAGATKAQFDATVGIHPTAAEEFVTMREPVPDPADEPCT